MQGDVIGLLNSNGILVANYRYNAWGKLLSVTNASGADIISPTHIANINPIRYRGYYYDTETGFYYLQSRYYDPETGRFISADGIVCANQDIISYNLFAYCSNNPVNYSDPSGEAATVIIMGVAIPCAYLTYLVATVGTVATMAMIANGDFADGLADAVSNAAGAVGDAVGSFFTTHGNASCPELAPSSSALGSANYTKAKDKTKDIAPPKPRRDPVHHIVAKGDHRAAESRDILRNVGIEPVTDPRNLVILPQSYHASFHTNAYYNYVNGRLRAVAGNKAGVEATLASLKEEILARSVAGIRWD